MTQANPSYLLIEDRLDAIGQKYRLWRLARGGMLFVGFAIVATLTAALIAHWLREGWWTKVILLGWGVWMAGSAWVWLVRPFLIRPRAAEVARLIEGRIGGLHNGLTNSVQLAGAKDLQASPFLPAIFDEVLRGSREKSLDEAVRFDALRPVGLKLSAVVGPMLLIALLWPGPFAHGWRQMFAPASFVNVVGAMKIESISPGDVTLVAGQPLEIAVVAVGEGQPEARLIFDHSLEDAKLSPTVRADGKLAYAYRAEFVEKSLRYRVEVGGSQSPWQTATVVPVVKVRELILDVTPPAYTKLEKQIIKLKADEIGKTPITVAQGSRVEMTLGIDVAMGGAMLQMGKATTPTAMKGSSDGMVFTAGFDVTAATTAQALLLSPSGQITSAVPEQALGIACTIDGPPSIEMKWPGQDVSVGPEAELKVSAVLKDDYGLSGAEVLMATAEDKPLASVYQIKPGEKTATLEHVLTIPQELRKHGQAIRVQVVATDNRGLESLLGEGGGAQKTASAVYEIRFRDEAQIAADQKQKIDAIRAKLLEMLKLQQELHTAAVGFKPESPAAMTQIGQGQTKLRGMMIETADGFEYDEQSKIIQKTLQVLAHGPAKDAIELAGGILEELVVEQRGKLNGDLQTKQRRIISTLESLLSVLNALPAAALTEKSKPGGDLATKAELEKLNEALKEFIKEQQRVLEQTAALAKKPVDNWDDVDKKLLEDLIQSQEKLDAFMQQKVNDFSKLAEQDMANSSLLKELLEVYSEVTMAKDALKKDPIEMAVSLEESGLELASEIQSNLEKWLMDEPDRIKWTMEDPLEKTDTPMAELPDELEDMIGELMEEQEDLFEEMEDTNANWTDSLDKGAGWDAADGPIANMTAKGVTGNQLPNNNEMGGRSGEGRSGKSQGEFVEETASGKGGRNTPTRLDPTAFEQGQVKDESKDPVGGATGGGKMSGQGGEGLEGPVPPTREMEMQRLKQKQAQLRNAAERINLQYQLGRYDNFKLLESIALMRRVESDMADNRYVTALRRRDVLLDSMDTSRLLTSGRIHVEHDSTPTLAGRMEDEIHDTMQGELPAAWEGALKAYYEKLARE